MEIRICLERDNHNTYTYDHLVISRPYGRPDLVSLQLDDRTVEVPEKELRAALIALRELEPAPDA